MMLSSVTTPEFELSNCFKILVEQWHQVWPWRWLQQEILRPELLSLVNNLILSVPPPLPLIHKSASPPSPTRPPILPLPPWPLLFYQERVLHKVVVLLRHIIQIMARARLVNFLLRPVLGMFHRRWLRLLLGALLLANWIEAHQQWSVLGSSFCSLSFCRKRRGDRKKVGWGGSSGASFIRDASI